MNIIAKKGNEKISLEQAIKLGILEISGNSLKLTDESYSLCQSTNLFDKCGKEIFVDDILVDESTDIHYKVISFYSTIYVQQLKDKNVCILETLTNFKLGNRVDFIVL